MTEIEELGMNYIRPQLDKSYEPYGETKMMELTRFDGYDMLNAFEEGSKIKKDMTLEEIIKEVDNLAPEDKKKLLEHFGVKEQIFNGKENRITAEKLQQGIKCRDVGIGNSMTPILKSKQAVMCDPVDENTILEKKDIVLAKVGGHYYLHLIHAIKGDQYLIGNNHGHMNGWVKRNNIFGKVVEIL